MLTNLPSYLSQSILCYRAFNLAQPNPNISDIKKGITLNKEQEEFLSSAMDLLRGNQTWEKAELRSAPMIDNPHDVDAISRLVDTVRESLHCSS